MAAGVFHFKQFAVMHDKCAMRVNTDGVLLGAWCKPESAKRILDIGTGTGVLALMMAQKNLTAIIDAVEIDTAAFDQCLDNFAQSQWAQRLNAIHSSIQNFLSPEKYDLIISNPPYFEKHYKTGNERRDIARHTLSLSHNDLLKAVSRLLSANGAFCIVLPYAFLKEFTLLGEQYKLYVTAITEVKAIEGKEPYLALLQLTHKDTDIIKLDQVAIQNTQGQYTDEYRKLTADFYLKF